MAEIDNDMAEIARLDKVNRQIEDMHAQNEYRPNGMFIVTREDKDLGKQYLVTQAVGEEQKNNWWAVPQGGIEKGNSLKVNLEDELAGELGIDATDLANEKFAITDEPFVQVYSADRSESERKRGRPDKGKAYFTSTAQFTGDPKSLKLKDGELYQYKWVSASEINELIENNSAPAKKEMLKQAIQAANS